VIERDPEKWEFTEYFQTASRLGKAGHLTLEECRRAIQDAVEVEAQGEDRIRVFCRMVIRGRLRIVRLVFLSDGRTLHNAHMDERKTAIHGLLERPR
jgi:Lon protease-like protein